MRQIVLDTETTGLSPEDGHRIIEIGCLELVNRRITGRTWHQYIHPEREIDEGAMQVHGISLADLEGKPRFAEILEEFLDFVRGAELVIHNAPFDMGFLDHEFRLAERDEGLADHCSVLDTLAMARERHPGQRNSLDALCQRYAVDNSNRELHGALLDAELLALVYLQMTGGQVGLALAGEEPAHGAREEGVHGEVLADLKIPLIRATEEEAQRHAAALDRLDRSAEQGAFWRRLEEGPGD